MRPIKILKIARNMDLFQKKAYLVKYLNIKEYFLFFAAYKYLKTDMCGLKLATNRWTRGKYEHSRIKTNINIFIKI